MPKYRSSFERSLAIQLRGTELDWSFESEKVPYFISHQYNPDFIIKKKDGSKVYIEAKGYFRAGDVAKMRAVKTQNPDLDIRFVFYDAHRKISGQKQTHAQWAERHGFLWADKKIPESWLIE